MRFGEIFERWTEGRLTQEEAADLLDVGVRQFRRQCRRYEAEGLEGLIDKRIAKFLSDAPRWMKCLRYAINMRSAMSAGM